MITAYTIKFHTREAAQRAEGILPLEEGRYYRAGRVLSFVSDVSWIGIVNQLETDGFECNDYSMDKVSA